MKALEYAILNLISGTIMVEDDYYRVLGVPENASAEEIRAAYHRLAFKYHPDRNSGAYAEEKMKNVNRAHDILSDPEKRVEYDRERRYGPGFSSRRSSPGNWGYTSRKGYTSGKEYTWRKEYTWTWERHGRAGRTSGRKEWAGYSGGPGRRSSGAGAGRAPGWESEGSNPNQGILDLIVRIIGIVAAIWILLLRPMLIVLLLIIIALLLAFWILLVEIFRVIRGKR